jgi:ubiquinone/menaquinone biosynthesis C-methylase UbiE
LNFNYDSIPVGYYDNVYHRLKGIQSKWHHHKFEHFRQSIDCAEKHLDLACGGGTFIGNYFNDNSFRVGIDIAPAQLAYARTRYGKSCFHFICCDGVSLPFADETFDIVTSIELIEHLSSKHATQTIKEAYRVLKPNGKLILTTPNYRSAIPIIEWMLNTFGDISYKNQHINRYNKTRLFKDLGQVGFEMVSVEPYLLLSPFFALFGWHVPDYFRRIEPGFVSKTIGLLLLGKGVKTSKSLNPNHK